MGERIRLQVRILDTVHPAHYGTVIQRSGGDLWGLKVRWDGGEVSWLTVAGFHLDNGDLTVVEGQ